MKKTLFLSLLLSVASSATETESPAIVPQLDLAQSSEFILPLPCYHESWTQEEKEILLQFIFKLERQFHAKFTPCELAGLPVYRQLRMSLHQSVRDGVIEQFVDGDSLCRWAAAQEDFDALKLFVLKGAECNISYQATFADSTYSISLIDSLLIPHTSGNSTRTAADRLDMIQWLVEHGFKLEQCATELTGAVIKLCLFKTDDITPIVEWYFSLNTEIPEDLQHKLYAAVLSAEGCTHIVKELVEEGKIALNEPLAENDMLPLQVLFTHYIHTINLPTLEYLLSAGADPNLHIAYEDDTNASDEYSPEGYEEEDKPNDDLSGFSTPIELAFDLYRISGDNDSAFSRSLLAAIDLLLYYGAELEIEDDEAGDEDAESPIYAEVRKRLDMTKEELIQDYIKLKS